MAKMVTLLEPVTPGELLWEEFMVPMGLSQYRLDKEIGNQKIVHPQVLPATESKARGLLLGPSTLQSLNVE